MCFFTKTNSKITNYISIIKMELNKAMLDTVALSKAHEAFLIAAKEEMESKKAFNLLVDQGASHQMLRMAFNIVCENIEKTTAAAEALPKK